MLPQRKNRQEVGDEGNFETMRLDVDDLPTIKGTNVSKEVARGCIAERKVVEDIAEKSDSVVITNYDSQNQEISTVVLNNQYTSTIEETIPDEENNKST